MHIVLSRKKAEALFVSQFPKYMGNRTILLKTIVEHGAPPVHKRTDKDIVFWLGILFPTNTYEVKHETSDCVR